MGSNPISALSTMDKFINKKEGYFILLISKEVAHKLNKEFGVPFGEGGISLTVKINGRHKYYVCESRKNLEALRKKVSSYFDKYIKDGLFEYELIK